MVRLGPASLQQSFAALMGMPFLQPRWGGQGVHARYARLAPLQPGGIPLRPNSGEAPGME
eukprot:scaffold2493_cov285-Prasinococcus_capsulatus_cf.AAC.5